MLEIVIASLASLVAGAGLAFGFNQAKLKKQKTSAHNVLEQAEAQAKKIVTEARDEAGQINRQAKQDEISRRKELERSEDRLNEREAMLDRRNQQIDQKMDALRQQNQELESLKDSVLEIRQKQEEKLSQIAKLSKEEAQAKLLEVTEKNMKTDLLGLIAKLKADAVNEAEEQSQMILLTAMERMSSEVTSEHTVTSVELPDDEMKGRIIGKEGRNIQALQRATGVDVLVDETPGMVVLSSFDPVRRQVARLSLELLMKDGRINPSRIEEVVAKAEKEIDKEIVRAGEDAAREVGLVGLPKEMLHILGELKYRTSYGQNVLKHSIEMTHLAGQIAEEIGADVKTTKTAALFHDVGKAVTHKIEGKHHVIGAELARKYGMSNEIAHAMEAHHDDIEATTPEALIVRVVDAVSAARPGARNISSENFVERMRDLENVALGFNGVEKAYAISAGRELRVVVKPEKIDDLSAIKLARDIAIKIESTMQYPGVIKVNVVRETRAEEYAK